MKVLEELNINIIYPVMCFVFFLTQTFFYGCEKQEDDYKIVSNSNQLSKEFKQAITGTKILLKEGTYKGSFNIPAGVILLGEDKDKTILESNNSNPVLTINTSNELSKIKNLTINAGKEVGIKTTGTGKLAIENLKIVAKGVHGIAVKSLTEFTAQNIKITGNVKRSSMNTITDNPTTRENYSSTAITLSKVKNAELNNIESSGFAHSVVQIIDSNTRIIEGKISDSLGTGILISGQSNVTINDTIISKIHSGATSFGYGIVVMDNAHLITNNVDLNNNSLAGMLVDHATGYHTNLFVDNNINRGIWMQFCEKRAGFNSDLAVIFDGQSTTFSNNKGVSLGAYKSNGVSINAATISDTGKLTMTAQGTETVTEKIGDGIEIISSTDIKIKDTVIFNSERVGAIVEYNPELQNLQDNLPEMDVIFENVIIDGVGDRGFLEQRGKIDQGPDVIPDALINADIEGGLLSTVRPINVDNLPSSEMVNNLTDID